MMWWGNGYGWGSWLVMILVMVGFWALAVVAIMSLIRGARDDTAVLNGRPARGEDPRKVLDGRFARRELDVQDYQARRGLLSQSSPETVRKHGASLAGVLAAGSRR